MNEATLGILLEMKENATTQIANVNSAIKTLGTETQAVTPKMTGSFSGLSGVLSENKAALRELSMGLGFLGSSFVSMGVSMQMTNSQTMKSTGNIIMMVGGIMSAVASSVHFVSAISKMVHALKELQMAEILAKAFSGPAGWATLLVGGAIAGGTVMALSRMQTSEAKVTKAEAKGGTTINVTQHIQGSVVTQREIADDVQKALLVKGQRQWTTGIK